MNNFIELLCSHNNAWGQDIKTQCTEPHLSDRGSTEHGRHYQQTPQRKRRPPFRKTSYSKMKKRQTPRKRKRIGSISKKTPELFSVDNLVGSRHSERQLYKTPLNLSKLARPIRRLWLIWTTLTPYPTECVTYLGSVLIISQRQGSHFPN